MARLTALHVDQVAQHQGRIAHAHRVAGDAPAPDELRERIARCHGRELVDHGALGRQCLGTQDGGQNDRPLPSHQIEHAVLAPRRPIGQLEPAGLIGDRPAEEPRAEATPPKRPGTL